MELGIGGAQFGLDYGINNPENKTSEAETVRILALATEKGVRVIDTANAYGDSESVLGKNLCPKHSFRIVTKTVPLRLLANQCEISRSVREGFFQSLKLLSQESIYGFLAHHAADLLGPFGNKIWNVLEQEKKEGRVKKIGVSVYTGVEIDMLLDRFPLEIVQLPINVLDQRLIQGGQLRRLEMRGVEIHARSVFLQGLLLMNPDEAPAYFAPVRPLLHRYHERLEQSSLSPVQGALAFIRNLPAIHVVLVGVNTAEQLRQNISDFNAAARIHEDWQEFSVNDPRYVNPALWKINPDRKNG